MKWHYVHNGTKSQLDCSVARNRICIPRSPYIHFPSNPNNMHYVIYFFYYSGKVRWKNCSLFWLFIICFKTRFFQGGGGEQLILENCSWGLKILKYFIFFDFLFGGTHWIQWYQRDRTTSSWRIYTYNKEINEQMCILAIWVGGDRGGGGMGTLTSDPGVPNYLARNTTS